MGGEDGGPSSEYGSSDLFLVELGVGDEPRKSFIIASGGYEGLVVSSPCTLPGASLELKANVGSR